ncbi:MAG: DNA mismatch repair endonuclease MutL [Lachnospiraceae bacterium]|nr:DNA mismatch repair endonuclease MutL [Lachnospiraceae bacterium]PWL68462.1 MAG: DNA mismatch repair endonuclease MutL [Clostridiaceae bacterium]
MAKIHVLSQDTINQIAAGEVVERPMAVVKELIENAIDAKASAVTVEIADGGKALIRITDNGSGIAADDIELAFLPHATSKIQNVEDLLAVSSLGFRGEALASIAAVSQLEMVTKTRDALMGTRYRIEGGDKKEIENVGCPDGTTFLVRNLFYNTPARLKFLKTSQTEAGYISGLVERMALSHPDIAFRFINQKQNRLSTSGNGNLKDVIYHIYGREVTSNLIEVQSREVFCTLSGYIGKPVISRGNRGMMNYFINGRYIKSPIIHRAIEEAYAPYSMQHRYPFTVLHIQIDAKYIDVNVHPQKMELRFNNEKEVFQSIYHGISEALRHREFIPDVTFHSEKKEEKKKAQPHIEPFEVKRQAQMNASGHLTPKDSLKALETLSKDLPDQKGSLEKQAVSQKTPFDEKETKERQKSGEDTSSMVQQQTASENPVTLHIPQEHTKSMVAEKAEYNTSRSVPVTNVVQQDLFEEGILSAKAQKEVKIIGQVFSTYWVLQYEDKMYMIDQHAAHEKVLYERFMKELEQKKIMTQYMNPPIILSLSMVQQQAVEENLELLESLGYQIENFGGKEYAVNGVPANLPNVGSKDLLIEIIDSMTTEISGKSRTPQMLKEKIASMSCKAAVKGNNKLPREEVEELLKELMTLENPYHCPHGRPTMISMTKSELEKKFKRIV